MSKLDYRRRDGYDQALARIPAITLRPLVSVHELREIAPVADALPELDFPINSAGELLDQIGEDATLPVLGMAVDPVRMIKYMPAYYFPIASYENFVEKMAELVRENRREFDPGKYIEKMGAKTRKVRFPIETREQLAKSLRDTPYFDVNGRKFDTETVIGELGDDFFPIRNRKDLQTKAVNYLRTRPLIEAD